MSSLLDELRAGLSGRYEIGSELGRGGMAVVFLATDLRHERKVAIKVLAPGVATGTGAERFQREIRSVARLSHPHVLPVLDSGELSGNEPRAWYVMPYVAGGTLRDRLEKEGPLPVADAVRIVAEAAEALDYAHRQGLIHRDVKPENVLLQDGQAVVADFGIAGNVDGDAEHRLTATGLVMGTARYMSPEQATGAESIDRRTDVYALGCVLHEALTGRAPFDAPTPQGVLARMISEDVPPVSRDRPAAASLDTVVAKALAKLPADRYGTARELAQALRASTPAQGVPVVSDAGPGVGDAGRGGRGSGVWRRRTLASVLTVAVGIATVAWLNARDRGGAVPGSVIPSLGLLPFDNLSPDPNDAYFAAGMHEEIRTQLSKVDGIELIVGSADPAQASASRSAVLESLGSVATVLEGSVRRAGDEVRLSFRLIDPAENDPLWAEVYERQVSDVFEIQAEVAARVVEELRGVLTPQERSELARRPPDNADALLPYLRGQASFRQMLFAEEGAQTAAESFQRAVEVDSGFAAAWAGLVQAHLFLAWLWGEPESRAEGRAALDRLEQIAPGTTELRFARGLWLYFGVEQYSEALAEFETVVEEWPGDVNALTWLGAAQRRALGREESLSTWERVLELDPTNASMASNVAATLRGLGRWEEAELYARRSVELNPDVRVHWWGWKNSYLERGDTARGRMVMDSAESHLGREGLESDGQWVAWQVLSGDFAEVLDVYRDIYDRDPRTLDGTWGPGNHWDWGIVGAARAGDTAAVRIFAESIRTRANEALAGASVDDMRTRRRTLDKLALAQAYLGEDTAAVRLAQELLASESASGDATLGTTGVRTLAQVYSVIGREDAAVEQLRQLLSMEPGITPAFLSIDPRWYGLRDHPGFQGLFAEAPTVP